MENLSRNDCVDMTLELLSCQIQDSLIAAIEKIYFSRRLTQTYADNKDFLPGRLAQVKASHAFQA